MTVLIDPPRWVAHGRRWSHLVSDSSFAELHTFADTLGLDRRSFEGDHYDVPEERYHQALSAGAHPVESRELLTRLQRAGLRRRKRRGEKVLASHPEAGGLRVDTVLSRLAPTAPDRSEILVLHRDGDLLAVRSTAGTDLPRSARPPAGGVQLGYLRYVDVAHEVTRRVEVVWLLHLGSGQEVGVAGPQDGGRWMSRARVAELIAPSLRPLLGDLGPGSSRWPP